MIKSMERTSQQDAGRVPVCMACSKRRVLALTPAGVSGSKLKDVELNVELA